MKIRFYNNLHKAKKDFIPIVNNQVQMYCCGVTVYDECHLGHARGAVNFDCLRRFFDHLQFNVTFVKNYTDIDDKIIQRANERNIDFRDLTADMINQHDQIMDRLNVITPHYRPKATDYIEQMIDMISNLIEQGYAYLSNQEVFFSVKKFKEYGKLSGKSIDELIAGARVEINKNKENHLDFSLWKPAKENEPSWDSPWGKGRPGWHIECSAMAKALLGDHFDIHLGGSDLLFPHHENEIAQSECANQKTLANYWLHNGMILVNGQKMSKSLGNFAVMKELLDEYHPELIRYFILQTHYRKEINFAHTAIEVALEGLDKLYQALFDVQLCYPDLLPLDYDKKQLEASPLYQNYIYALADDLNSPKAFSFLFEMAHQIQINLKEKTKTGYNAALLRYSARILGLLEIEPMAWFQSLRIIKGKKELGAVYIDQLLIKRNEARAEKDWHQADSIRDQLKNNNIIIKDLSDKTIWYYK